ncbi:MAG: helix-turn-helix domain-containing protein [Myxococcales bacterium]|nr:helix-turn-helix domain-containing protein [Myxococcales bacterium]
MTATHRQHDPEARRLLVELERLESSPWPATLDAYAAALLALGQRCEQPQGMAEFHRWSTARLAGLLNGRAPAWREWRSDALADVTATIAGTLWAFRAGLDARRRPNLLSMVRAAVIWRANDIAESLHHRHQRRRGRPAALEETASSADAFTVAFAREVCAQLAAGPAPEHALLLIGQGESIAEAARRTGASRQQVYRARERLAARAAMSVGVSDGARELPRRVERVIAGAFNGRGELVGRWARGAAQ